MAIQGKQARAIVAGVAVLALAACTQGNQRFGGNSAALSSQPSSLEPQPAPNVDSGPLEPSQPTPPDPAENLDSQGLPGDGTDVAAVDDTGVDPSATNIDTPDRNPPNLASTAASAARPVSREALIAAWTVASGATNCQIFLALTRWQGGFRAAQRGCSGSDISGVQSWDVKDNRVVLNDGNGTQVATLSKTGDEAFSGSTQGGGGISFSR